MAHPTIVCWFNTGNEGIYKPVVQGQVLYEILPNDKDGFDFKGARDNVSNTRIDLEKRSCKIRFRAQDDPSEWGDVIFEDEMFDWEINESVVSLKEEHVYKWAARFDREIEMPTLQVKSNTPLPFVKYCVACAFPFLHFKV